VIIPLDGGVLIELLTQGETLPFFQSLISGSIMASATILALTEAQYILCRKIGAQAAEQKIENLIESNCIEIFPLDHLRKNASILKCKRKMALPDCFTIALGMFLQTHVLFATRETELNTEMEKDPFTIGINFLNEL
jgi:hypothetical protein